MFRVHEVGPHATRAGNGRVDPGRASADAHGEGTGMTLTNLNDSMSEPHDGSLTPWTDRIRC